MPMRWKIHSGHGSSPRYSWVYRAYASSAAHAAKPAKLTRRRLARTRLLGKRPLGGRRRGRTGGAALAQLALDVIERGVADVLAVHHVDDVLADVLGVITDALERTHHPHDIQRTADGARILHHEGDALTLDRLVFLIHHAVLARDAQRRVDVHARERIQRVVHHLRHHAPQMLDLAVLVGRALHGRKPRGDVADLLALIPDALQIGDGLDDRHDHAQIAGGRRARREDAAAFLVDGDLHVVHLVVIERDRLPERAVALHQRGDGLLQLLLDEAAHAEHLAAHALEVLVEATRDVVTEVGGFHQLASPASLVCLRAAIRAMITELRLTASVARNASGIGTRPARNCAVAACQLKPAARSAHIRRSSRSAERIASLRSWCRTPVTSCSMTSRGPGTGKAATGTPQASASIIASPKVSVRLGNTSTSAVARQRPEAAQVDAAPPAVQSCEATGGQLGLKCGAADEGARGGAVEALQP